MVLLFAPYVVYMFMPMAVNAEVCGGTSGPPCNASALYSDFESVYLAAADSNMTQGMCIRLERQENEEATIHYRLENGTEIFQDTQSYTFTDAPDVINITFGSAPDMTFVVHIPYADSEACFVTKFDTAMLGCRLWIRDGATSAQITACTDGLSQACPGTVYDTWNEEACATTA